MHPFFNQFSRPRVHPEMEQFTESQILEHLRSRPLGVKKLLALISKDELQKAIEEQERLEDQEFERQRQRRTSPQQRQNVCSLTCNQLIQRCRMQRISLYGALHHIYETLPLERHPEFGHKLVDLKPHKYYIDKSRHYSHASEIDRLYEEWDGIGANSQLSPNDSDERQSHEGDDGSGLDSESGQEPRGEEESINIEDYVIQQPQGNIEKVKTAKKKINLGREVEVQGSNSISEDDFINDDFIDDGDIESSCQIQEDDSDYQQSEQSSITKEQKKLKTKTKRVRKATMNSPNIRKKLLKNSERHSLKSGISDESKSEELTVKRARGRPKKTNPVESSRKKMTLDSD